MSKNLSENEALPSVRGSNPVIQILGIIILGFGLLLAVTQTSFIGNQAFFGDQSELLGDLCWIVVGMTVELFGIGLIILGRGK